ncbi:hypothetical protein P9J83_14705 [Clostridium sporogenes]|uniref:Uncharacterized protein n=1 Tax=Clostridium sporogenes TaxID=1509 RepID=A0AAE4JTM7_CLOSG|nr:hypothetical protein [Clostridium sporogenes]MDS1004735.1 hypothetical protein [Clostridium sporogenes]
MKYKKVRYIHGGKVETINLAIVNDSNREKYRHKLYCPEPDCPAKLGEYRVNGVVYYRADKNSHNEDCPYKDDVNGYRGIGEGEEIEVLISEKHLIQSVRRSYKYDNDEKKTDNNNSDDTTSKGKKVKSNKKTEDGEMQYRLRGVVNGGGIKKPKEPPILNRYEVTKRDVGYTRKITNVTIDDVQEIEGTLKIWFKESRYKNLYASIGESYLAENGIDYEKIKNLKTYIKNKLKNGEKISFYGAGMINEIKDLFVLELFYQESFLVDGKDILRISAIVNRNL